MPVPTPTNSATVHIGSGTPRYYYVAPYRGQFGYSFYRGTTRWMCLTRIRADVDSDDVHAVFRSLDNGEIWELMNEAGAPVQNPSTNTGLPAYDVRFGAGLDPNSVTKITSLYASPDTSPSEHHLKYVDFDFVSGSWGAPYGAFDVLPGVVGLDFSTAPDASLAYVLYGPTATWTLYGVPSGGADSPGGGGTSGLVVDAASQGHKNGTAVAMPIIGNVRIVGSQIVYPQFSLDSAHIQVVRGDLAGTTWTPETVSAADGLFTSGATNLWLRGGNRLYWIGADNASLYRSVKSGGVWQVAELIWSAATDANPYVYSGVGAYTAQPCVSDNPVLGGIDVSLDTYLSQAAFDAGGDGEGTITFHTTEPNTAAARYYGH